MKNESVTVSNKITFALLASEPLSLSPSLYQRTSIYDPTWRIINELNGDGRSTPTTTDLKLNKYKLEAPYIPETTTLKMSNKKTNATFNLEKKGSKVTYSSTGGSVQVSRGWGIITSVVLTVAATSHLHAEAPSVIDGENGIKYLVAGSDARSYSGEDSIEISDDTYFTFVTNTNMYFSVENNSAAAIYMMISNKLEKVENRMLLGFASQGGRYALTGDEENLYPEGISTLVIDDGFSESRAKIEFNHNTFNKTVKISIKSHSADVCELRDSEIVFAL
ncbi:hypothetical protein [Pseudomonas syringae]|uniref:hypothetical protein n=1 Tax=Pseudomonas syringae TaxID=317 RepID=UPI001F3DB637|nr:hypothetical protein [Pseudomonas syringae]MCF5702345.1 hypothetical protein [Pseudomonas syringae]